jgi:sugar-phosphatase
MTRPLFPDRTHAACLFDMDGTILSSIAAAERVWSAWAAGHGIELATFLPTLHGRRAVDTIASLGLAGVDVAREAALIEAREIEDVAGIEPIAGAARFLAALPPDRWAIVTSAPRALALRRLEAAGLPVPAVLVAAEDVQRGKPAPDCFLLAAQRLGLPIGDCLVFEDTPAGIAAAEAAGADALVITATHAHPMASAHPAVRDYDGLVAERAGTRLRLRAAA